MYSDFLLVMLVECCSEWSVCLLVISLCCLSSVSRQGAVFVVIHLSERDQPFSRCTEEDL